MHVKLVVVLVVVVVVVVVVGIALIVVDVDDDVEVVEAVEVVGIVDVAEINGSLQLSIEQHILVIEPTLGRLKLGGHVEDGLQENEVDEMPVVVVIAVFHFRNWIIF